MYIRILLLALFIGLMGGVSCKGPRGGNGEGIAGFNDARFETVRLHCDYQKASRTQYGVTCQPVYVDQSDNEVVLSSIPSGVAINWHDPQTVGGPAPTALSCQTETLRQQCQLTIPGEEVTTLKFAVEIKDLDGQREKNESALIMLPVTATTLGLVPQLPNYLPAQSNAAGMGVQIPEVPAGESNLGVADALCFQKDAIYFAAGRLVYVLRDGKVKLFAGSGNSSNVNDFSHRLRVSFSYNVDGIGLGLKLACGDDAVFVSDAVLHRVLKISTVDSSVTLYAGNGKHGISKDGLPANQSELFYPRGLTVSPDGTLYIADWYSRRVRMVNQEGLFKTVAGSGRQGSCPSGSPALGDCFKKPFNIAWVPDGSLIVGDDDLLEVRKVRPDGIIETIVGGGTVSNPPDGTPGTQIRLVGPLFVAASPGGEIYFSDFSDYSVRKLSADGKVYRVVGGGSKILFARTKTPMKASEIRIMPWGMGISPTGILYVLDTLTQALLRVDQGMVSQIFSPLDYSTDKNTLTDQPVALDRLPLSSVFGVKIGPADEIYFSDEFRHAVYRVTPDGKQALPIRQNFSRPTGLAFRGDTLIAANRLHQRITSYKIDLKQNTILYEASGTGLGNIMPEAIAANAKGMLFIADQDHNRIYQLSPENELVPFAGTGEGGYSGDGGPALAAKIYRPHGIIVLKDGSVAFADGANNVIRKIDSNGIISTIAGKYEAGISADGLNARESKMNHPFALALGESGRIYIGDSRNSRVAVLKPGADGSYTLSTLVGGNQLNRDCSNSVSSTIPGTNIESEVKASLSVLCLGEITALDVKESCSVGTGNITIVFAQRYGTGNSNLIKISRPCDTAIPTDSKK